LIASVARVNRARVAIAIMRDRLFDEAHLAEPNLHRMYLAIARIECLSREAAASVVALSAGVHVS
jgi:hypothetical protein